MQCDACGALLPAEARFCLSCGTRVASVPAPENDPLLEALTKAIGFQYRIERLLGRGGMGAVYLAHELALDRDVAIKVLPPEQADTPQARERFRREARTAARLSHPNIVPLHTFGEVSGLVYFVMGYVAGESLASRLKREGAMPSEEARRIFVAMCEALPATGIAGSPKPMRKQRLGHCGLSVKESLHGPTSRATPLNGERRRTIRLRDARN